MKRNIYNREFKIEAVKLVLEQDMTIEQVRKDLGIGYSTLNKWICAYQEDPQNAFPGKGHLKPADNELYQLKKKLHDTEMERDILKKAMSVIATLQK